MGMEHVTWAWIQVENIPMAAKAVLMGIANYADRRGFAWPSYSSIAKNLNTSLSTVRRNVAELEKMGALERRERILPSGKKTSNVYRLNMDFRGFPGAGPASDDDGGDDLEMLELFGAEGDSSAHTVQPEHTKCVQSEGCTLVTGERSVTLNQGLLKKKEEEESARIDLEEKFQELVDIFEPGPTEDLAHGRAALANLEGFERTTALKHAARFVEALKLEKRKQVSIANYLSRKRWESVERYTPRPVKPGEGKPTVWVLKGSPEWEAWAKFKGKPLACIRSSEHREDGFYFVSAMPPAMVT